MISIIFSLLVTYCMSTNNLCYGWCNCTNSGQTCIVDTAVSETKNNLICEHDGQLIISSNIECSEDCQQISFRSKNIVLSEKGFLKSMKELVGVVKLEAENITILGRVEASKIEILATDTIQMSPGIGSNPVLQLLLGKQSQILMNAKNIQINAGTIKAMKIQGQWMGNLKLVALESIEFGNQAQTKIVELEGMEIQAKSLTAPCDTICDDIDIQDIFAASFHVKKDIYLDTVIMNHCANVLIDTKDLTLKNSKFPSDGRIPETNFTVKTVQFYAENSYVSASTIQIEAENFYQKSTDLVASFLGHQPGTGGAPGINGIQYGGGGGNGGAGGTDCEDETGPSNVTIVDEKNPWVFGSGGGFAGTEGSVIFNRIITMKLEDMEEEELMLLYKNTT